MMPPAAAENSNSIHSIGNHDTAPALMLVRISAIGDTILASRTHRWALEKGYRPFLVTHASNVSLLNCMPLLAGACLVGDHDFKFLLKQNENPDFKEVDEKQFSEAIRSANKPTSHTTAKPLHQIIHLADLQATRRSRRTIQQLKKRLAPLGISFRRHEVSKITFWRVLLVVWCFLRFKQRAGLNPPLWLRRKLKPVYRLQKTLLDELPSLPPVGRPDSGTRVLKSPSTDVGQPHGLEPNDKHIVLLLGSSHKLKSWPQAHFRKLTELILARTSLQIVLCGGKEDHLVANYLAYLNPSRIIDLAGKTPLSETLLLIQKASYVVTGDSFGSHAADLLGTPASVLFGATHPLLGFAPESPHVTIHHKGYSCSPCSRHGQGECRYKNIRCLTTITPEEVFSKIEQVLARNGQ
ncbi:MAG: glycosyltransferase family 9 protein [Silvanigrellaceae bacterium]